jgi:hypothetical protein
MDKVSKQVMSFDVSIGIIKDVAWVTYAQASNVASPSHIQKIALAWVILLLLTIMLKNLYHQANEDTRALDVKFVLWVEKAIEHMDTFEKKEAIKLHALEYYSKVKSPRD